MTPLEYVEIVAVAAAEAYVSRRASATWKARIALWEYALNAAMRT